MVRQIFLFIIIFSCIACGMQDKEKIDAAIYEANLKLSGGDCQGAIALLNNIPRPHNNALFHITLASAYACKANFSSITFFTEDIDKLSANADEMFNSLATFSSSIVETTAESQRFLDMQKGIETLLHAGNQTYPDANLKKVIFGNVLANDMNLQLIYMILAQMGKWFYYFGDSDSNTGIKDGCLYSYTSNPARILIDSEPTGACGGPQYLGVRLSGNTEQTRRRMCYPVILFNNLIDVLKNTMISSSSTTGALDDILDQVGGFYDDMCDPQPPAPAITELCQLRTVSACVDAYATDNEPLQVFYAGVFEAMFL